MWKYGKILSHVIILDNIITCDNIFPYFHCWWNYTFNVTLLIEKYQLIFSLVHTNGASLSIYECSRDVNASPKRSDLLVSGIDYWDTISLNYRENKSSEKRENLSMWHAILSFGDDDSNQSSSRSASLSPTGSAKSLAP